jgi:pimeloyl-ACP methyl ester carboxylesterase
MDRRNVIAMGASAAVGITVAAMTGGAAAAGPDGSQTNAQAGHSDATLVRSLPGDFEDGHARVNGTVLHYVAGGRGEPLFLLPGWPQTWWTFHRIMPSLAGRYRVIAVDLRGMGGSDKPEAGYDKKTMARDVLELAHHLGYRTINIAGHDIGSMVAFSFAVNHPDAAQKVALMDIPHPDQGLYTIPMLSQSPDALNLWWFAFNQLHGLPEQLLTGRSRYLIDWIFDNIPANPAAIDERDRAIYSYAYSNPDAIRASNGWYQSLRQDIDDAQNYGKVTAPMLGITTEQSDAYLKFLWPSQGTDVQLVKIEKSIHFVVDEQPTAVAQALTKFFG